MLKFFPNVGEYPTIYAIDLQLYSKSNEKWTLKHCKGLINTLSLIADLTFKHNSN